MRQLLILLTYLSLSSLKSFAFISAPSISSPNNGASVLGFSAVVRINGVTAASGYQYEFDSVSTFNSPYRYRGDSSSTSFITPQFKKGVRVYWRVRAYVSGDTSNWSGTGNFIIAVKARTGSPNNNLSGYITRLNIANDVYTASNQQVLYLFQTDTTPNFTSPVASIKTNNVSSYIDTPLFKFGNTIFWRVSIVSIWGDTLDWSDVSRYNILSNMVKPKVSSGNNPRCVLDWFVNTMAGIEVQYDTTVLFTSANSSLLPANTNSFKYQTIDDLFFGKTYYFRARQVFNDSYSDWSDTTSVNIFGGQQLFEPVNNSTVTSLNPSFSWIIVQNVKQRIQLFADSAYTQLLFDTITTSTNPVTSSINYPNLLNLNRWYYTRVCYLHAKDTSIWHNSKFKTYNGLVNIYSPQLFGVVAPKVTIRYATFSWAKLYQIELDSGQIFTSKSVLLNVKSQPGTFNSIDTLLRIGGTYVLRIRAIRDQDTGVFGVAPLFFYIANQPVLNSPYDGASVEGTNPTVYAYRLDGSRLVQWQLDTSRWFDSPAILQGFSNYVIDSPNDQRIMLKLPKDLFYRKNYYWRVRMISQQDTTFWSSHFRFFTNVALYPYKPEKNAINVSVRPFLTWNVIGKIDENGYQYQLSTDNEFSSIVMDRVTNYGAIGDTISCAFATKYYWRLRAFHSRDTSTWSPVSSFTTLVKPNLVAPILALPSANAVNVPVNTVNLSWNYSNEQVLFEVQVASDEILSQLVHQKTTTSKIHLVHGLNANTTYYWRVRARVDALQDTAISSWSAIRSFKTIPAVGLSNEELKKLTNVYPNPANTKIHIETPLPSSITLFDCLGSKVDEFIAPNRIHELETSGWNSGVYLLQITTSEGTVFKKIEIVHP